MPKNKKAATSKKEDRKAKKSIKHFIKQKKNNVKTRVSGLLQRRPHRSLKRTIRRDYVRSLKLPGYWAFTSLVFKTLWKNKKIFLGVIAGYAILTLVLVGMVSQTNYTDLGDAINEVFDGQWNAVEQAGALLFANITTAYSGSNLTQLQQVSAIILSLFMWLTVVWLLRSILAGNKPKIRDALYSSGGPIIPTFSLYVIGILQLLPVVLAIIIYGAGTSTGFLQDGVEAMLFWTGIGLLALLSLYWMTSTFIALIVVTLPGTYPLQALKIAGDLVVGRRIRLLLRFLWLLGLLVVTWLLVLIPIILIDTWLKDMFSVLNVVPLVPLCIVLMSAVSVAWAASYIYLLYRKVVDDDAAPA